MESIIVECPMNDSIMGTPASIAIHLMSTHYYEHHEAIIWMQDAIKKEVQAWKKTL